MIYTPGCSGTYRKKLWASKERTSQKPKNVHRGQKLHREFLPQLYSGRESWVSTVDWRDIVPGELGRVSKETAQS